MHRISLIKTIALLFSCPLLESGNFRSNSLLIIRSCFFLIQIWISLLLLPKCYTAWLVRFLWMSEAGRQPYRLNFGLKPTWLKRKCLEFFGEVIRLAKFWALLSFLRQNWQWRRFFVNFGAAGGSCFYYALL